MNKKEADLVCNKIHKTYNMRILDDYPNIKEVFVEVMDMYEKNPKKYPNVNKTLMALFYNLVKSRVSTSG